MIRIGSLLCMLGIAAFVYAQPLTISLYDMNNMPVSQCVRGVPYAFHISLYNISGGYSTPILHVPDGWRKEPSQTVRRHIERGITTVTYIYTIVPERPGTYTLGPIRADVGNDTIVSNTLSIVVKEKANSSSAGARALLFFNVPVSQAYVGQEIPCSLQFCSKIN